jgi:hypothetical protein
MRAHELFTLLMALSPPEIRPVSPPAWVERELRDLMSTLTGPELAALRERFKDDPEGTRIIAECAPSSPSSRTGGTTR